MHDVLFSRQPLAAQVIFGVYYTTYRSSVLLPSYHAMQSVPSTAVGATINSRFCAYCGSTCAVDSGARTINGAHHSSIAHSNTTVL